MCYQPDETPETDTIPQTDAARIFSDFQPTLTVTSKKVSNMKFIQFPISYDSLIFFFRYVYIGNTYNGNIYILPLFA